jgi:hypothetical protein
MHHAGSVCRQADRHVVVFYKTAVKLCYKGADSYDSILQVLKRTLYVCKVPESCCSRPASHTADWYPLHSEVFIAIMSEF